MTSEQKVILDRELDECRSDLEKLGAKINGYSGGSPEGDVWQFTFRFECPLPPDRASAEIGVYWQRGWAEKPENDMRIYRTASIFREGSVPIYENREGYGRSIIGAPLSLKQLVAEAMQACRSEIERASNKSVNFASSVPNS